MSQKQQIESTKQYVCTLVFHIFISVPVTVLAVMSENIGHSANEE